MVIIRDTGRVTRTRRRESPLIIKDINPGASPVAKKKYLDI